MTLTENDFAKIKKNTKTVNLSIGKYFSKRSYGNSEYDALTFGVNELIGHYIFTDLDLISPKYFIVKSNDDYYVLSEDLNNHGTFLTLDEMRLDFFLGSSLYTIWDYLENTVGVDEELFKEIIKMYIADIFIMNVDRKPDNWGIIFTNTKHVGIIDNEEILVYPYLVPFISPMEKEKWQECILEVKESNRSDKKYLGEIKQIISDNLLMFLKESSDEYIELFKNIYELMTPEYFINLLKRIEKENYLYKEMDEEKLIIPHKDKLIKIYKENYNCISKVWELYQSDRRMK